MNGKKSRLRRTKLTVSLVAAVSAVVGMTAFGAGSAFAGENGQEITLCRNLPSSTSPTTVSVIGTNQNGEDTIWEHELLNIPCQNTAGYFWVGEVTFFWRRSTGTIIKITTCDVPRTAPSIAVRCDFTV